MLVEFAAGRAESVILRHNFVVLNGDNFLIYMVESNFLPHIIKNVSFSQGLLLTIPLRCMLVEFAAGRAKNVVLRHYLVDDSVKKYSFFCEKLIFDHLKLKMCHFRNVVNQLYL